MRTLFLHDHEMDEATADTAIQAATATFRQATTSNRDGVLFSAGLTATVAAVGIVGGAPDVGILVCGILAVSHAARVAVSAAGAKNAKVFTANIGAWSKDRIDTFKAQQAVATAASHVFAPLSMAAFITWNVFVDPGHTTSLGAWMLEHLNGRAVTGAVLLNAVLLYTPAISSRIRGELRE